MATSRRELLALADPELLRQCEVDCFRASGPGGQKRNKTESAVRLRLPATGLIGLASESRSQHENKQRALRRLRATIALELREPVVVDGYRPTAALVELLAAGNHRRGPRERNQPDYLAGMAALIDLLVAVGGSVSDAARRLDTSTGSLSRLLLGDERVARKVNQLRSGLGLRPLR
jgi:hypothetical protein